MCLKVRYYLIRSVGSIILIVLLAIRIGFGQNYWVQVVNKTGYYIHVFINQNPYLYLKPDGHFKDSFDTSDIKIRVIYSPGQIVNGEVSRQFYARTGSDILCEGGIFCNEDPSLSVNWHVTPDDFMGSDTLNILREN